MRLISVRIKNFRRYKDEVKFWFDDITALIGRNDAGKSSILEALDIFFNTNKMEYDDFCKSPPREDSVIACEFDDLPDFIVIDSSNKTSLADEFCLNEHGYLEIEKHFSASGNQNKSKSFLRCFHPIDEKLKDLLIIKSSELRKRINDLDLTADVTRNSEMRRAIRQHYSNPSKEITLIPADKIDERDIYAKLKQDFPIYALFKSDRENSTDDDEVQNPLLTSVKEALDLKRDEIEKITKFVEEHVNNIMNLTIEKIQKIDVSISDGINPNVSLKDWSKAFSTKMTSDDAIPWNKRGSGVRRILLLSFFMAQAEKSGLDDRKSNIIYGIEEPETGQHPKNQILLLQSLRTLSADPNRQIIFTTHNPNFIQSINLSNVYFIPSDKNLLPIKGDSKDFETDLITKEMGIFANHSVKCFIGVEGKHDITFLKNLSLALKKSGETVIDIEDLEKNGNIIFVPCGGSTLSLWVSRVSSLNIPEIYIFDRDEIPPKKPKYQEQIDKFNQNSYTKAYCTDRREIENYICREAVCEEYQKNGCQIEIRNEFGEFDNVPEIVAKSVFEGQGSDCNWDQLDDKSKKSKISSAKAQIAKAAIHMTDDRLKAIGAYEEVLKWFRDIASKVRSHRLT